MRVRKRVTLMVITITAIFGICWVPDIIAHSIDYYSSLSVSFSAYAVIHTLVLFNSTVNPFVYALISQTFREKLKGMICQCRCTDSKGFRSTITKKATGARKSSEHGKSGGKDSLVREFKDIIHKKMTFVSAFSSLSIPCMLSRETKYFRLFSHQNRPIDSQEKI